MMTIRWLVASGALLGLAALPLHAQTQTAAPPDVAKAAPKKKEAVKDAPAKDAKAAAATKDNKKKAAPKAVAKDDKKAAPKKSAADAKKPAAYSTKSMEIRDDKGNVIPISPDAYDVSSALPGKSPPKK